MKYVVLILLIGLSTQTPVCAERQTTKERGMLNLNEALSQGPRIRLCEVLVDGTVRLRTCSRIPQHRRPR